MPRLARFLLVLAITLSTIASTATAASADPGTGSATGGAGVDPAGPSAAERKRIAEKETELRQWLASLRSSKANQPSPQVHTIYRSGFVLGWNYSEAQACYAANWCGAGSTAGIVASWKYRNGLPNPVTSNSYYEGGPTGYMKHLARDLAETRYSDNGDSGAACYDDVTWWTDSSGVSVGYLAVTNSEGPGWSYYVAVGRPARTTSSTRSRTTLPIRACPWWPQ
ncbi:MAG TPA: hypothetical protein VFM93_13060 [Candidatus Limnocylindria bacterium]|nr:hypothetical protein [Candidatus Limnocylindria bacterium]